MPSYFKEGWICVSNPPLRHILWGWGVWWYQIIYKDGGGDIDKSEFVPSFRAGVSEFGTKGYENAWLSLEIFHSNELCSQFTKYE